MVDAFCRVFFEVGEVFSIFILEKFVNIFVRRPLGRPKNRWEDDIRDDMKELKIKNWTSRIQDRNKWKLYVERGKTLED